jgi:hypothetical protein
VRALADALTLATGSGLLDNEFWDVLDPESINEFCGAVAELEKALV